MNAYKGKRDQFFSMFSSHAKRLEQAIRDTCPLGVGIVGGQGPEHMTRQVNSLKNLLSVLNTRGFRTHFYWNYVFNATVVADWCQLWWETDSGLYIHFEWLNTTSRVDMQDVAMDARLWEEFFKRRKAIFCAFDAKRLLPWAQQENVAIRLTDHLLREA